jgi:pilus assembly protein Flp/PilA
MFHLYASLVSLVSIAKDRLRQEEKGATAVEYGLMVGLIAVAIIVTVGLLGDQLDALFATITAALP